MRFELITPETIQMRESLGLVKDVYDVASSIKEPLSSYRAMLDLVHRDSTLATAYAIIVDFLTVRGYDFSGGTKAMRDKLRLQFEDLNFTEVLPNLAYSLLYYGDAFLELRKNDSSVPNELWVLETTEMRIDYDIHGKVNGYIQRPFSLSGLSDEQILEQEKLQGIFFAPDEVIHFRMKWIGSQVYSYNPNEPISQAASTKLYAGNYLLNIFMNMPPRYVLHLAGISNKDYVDAKQEFRSTKTNYRRTIAFSRSSDPNSKLQIQKIEPPYDAQLIEIIKWLNSEILKITRVPRTWVEKEGTENRGVGESLNLPFEMMITGIHRNILEPELNKKLLVHYIPEKKPKNAKHIALRFNEISKKGENETLMNAGLLRDFGLKSEALVTYLDDRGILGLDPEDFEEQQLQKNMELNPSRQRMNPRVNDMTQNRNEAGVSEESAAKMSE